VRLQALDALVTDGENDPPIAQDPSSAALPEAALLAAAGDARGIESLLLALQNPAANKSAAIAGLAKSRSPRAIDPLIALLAEPDPILRAAAAEALGTLGATQAILQLKALLADPVFTVHLAAAGALLALKDTSGLDWLGQLQASEHPGIRLAAARAARGRPDSAWLDLVRSLTRDAEPDIRRQAAELIAPHDPEAARATLEPLLKDSNPAQREAAQIAYLQSAVSDLAELRKFMRNPDALARVHAAGRILQLTR
jgi:HEAT repeat protein